MPFVQQSNSVQHCTGAPLAHYEGEHEPALLNVTVSHHFSTIVERFGDCLAIKSGQQHLTYRQLDVESDAVALALHAQGVRPGDRVATSLGINVAHVLPQVTFIFHRRDGGSLTSLEVASADGVLKTIYACFKLGAVLTPLNPSYSAQQVVSALRHVGASMYVVSSHLSLPYKEPRSTRDLLNAVLAECNKSEATPLKLLVVGNRPTTCGGRASETSMLHDFDHVVSLHKGQRFSSSTSLDPQDTINLQFTSGTTSTPKAVALTHWNVLNNAYILAHLWGTTHKDMYVCTMPLYHCGGMGAVILAAMSHGAAVSLPGESFNALQTLRAIRDDRCTILHGVPTMFHAWIELLKSEEFANHDFSHIRCGLIGAAPILPSLRKTINERLHVADIGNTYGMTELCPALTFARPSDPPEKKYGTVGRAIPHQSVRIVTRDDPSRVLRVGEKGEILGAGMVMKEYFADPERTAAAIHLETMPDGSVRRWMRTGDEGMMDVDGFVMVTGRIKDLIIRGGENINPNEIEDVIVQHPGVKAASVVGLPDERYGEVVAAFVVVDEAKTVALPRESQNEAPASAPCDLDLRCRRDAAEHGPDTAENLVLTGAQLRAWTRSKLSGHLVPKYIIWTDELPLTATGKVEKHKLRDRGTAALLSTAVEQGARGDQSVGGRSDPTTLPPTSLRKEGSDGTHTPSREKDSRGVVVAIAAWFRSWWSWLSFAHLPRATR